MLTQWKLSHVLISVKRAGFETHFLYYQLLEVVEWLCIHCPYQPSRGITTGSTLDVIPELHFHHVLKFLIHNSHVFQIV